MSVIEYKGGSSGTSGEAYHAGGETAPADNAGKKRVLTFTNAVVVADSVRVIGSVNRLPEDAQKNSRQMPEVPEEDRKIPVSGKRMESEENVPLAQNGPDGALVSRAEVLRALSGDPEEVEKGMPQFVDVKKAQAVISKLRVRKDPSLLPAWQPGSFRNEADITGKIIKKIRRQDRRKESTEMITFYISCGYRGMKRDEAGYFKKDMVPVCAYGAAADALDKEFGIGERVVVHGLVQRIPSSSPFGYGRTIISCLKMERSAVRDIGTRDWNTARLTGPIMSAAPAGDGWVNIYVRTVVDAAREERVRVPGRDEDNNIVFHTEIRPASYRYASITRVRVFASENRDDPEGSAEETLRRLLTPGTWVDITGHIYGRVAPEGYNEMRRTESRKRQFDSFQEGAEELKKAWAGKPGGPDDPGAGGEQ